jgi:hypothetical protein
MNNVIYKLAKYKSKILQNNNEKVDIYKAKFSHYLDMMKQNGGDMNAMFAQVNAMIELVRTNDNRFTSILSNKDKEIKNIKKKIDLLKKILNNSSEIFDIKHYKNGNK